MIALLETLELEHVAILNTLKAARMAGVHTEAGRELLVNARALIMEHLRKEDEFVYTRMHDDPEAGAVSDQFCDEMRGLAPVLNTFFDKYETSEHASEFSGELGRLLGILQKRITREEFLLYPTVRKAQTAA
ncbi:hemerythrin domain-containing protein [Ponticaulis sp.]|uniref:hemerythrin domain-containing protein n=1 Tax=Ponticaulis sp. TaxID=2020902 RepID=UPI000B68BD47|nr:hemerythrin domain-containing protein [Ponticaulis sp.]MAI90303.1 hypothetical protein [Ponticaulis sp.]OUX99944.1 MAG: hypothetical protein CBB65_07670 [Hyphomonadaceae bacterium TMED5]|tara:strand:- start:281304 stop:281699 length:396 start_codon:yes stop_codon:yes gene_type:complete